MPCATGNYRWGGIAQYNIAIRAYVSLKKKLT